MSARQMIRKMVTYYHRHGVTLRTDHWQDAEVVRAQQRAERDRVLRELARLILDRRPPSFDGHHHPAAKEPPQ